MKLGDVELGGSINAGSVPTADDGSITDDLVAWKKLKTKISESVNAGQVFSNGIVSTYTLVNTAGGYVGGVLAPNGDIHFVPFAATMGQKISTLPGKPFDLGMCCSPWFNKF